jgi:hypothetical protein
MTPDLILEANWQAYKAMFTDNPLTKIDINNGRIIVFSRWGAMSVQAYKALTQ